MSKIESIFKNTTINNISNLNKDKFYEAFLIGNDFYTDYIYLKKNFPDMINSLNLNGEWKDYQGDTKILDKDICALLRKHNNGLYLIGEASFIDEKNRNIIWLRYNDKFLFKQDDYLISRNGESYKGCLPKEERKCEVNKMDSTILGGEFLNYTNLKNESLDIAFYNYKESIEISFISRKLNYKFTLKVYPKSFEDNNIRYVLTNLDYLYEKTYVLTSDFLNSIKASIVDIINLGNKKLDISLDIFDFLSKNSDAILKASNISK